MISMHGDMIDLKHLIRLSDTEPDGTRGIYGCRRLTSGLSTQQSESQSRTRENSFHYFSHDSMYTRRGFLVSRATFAATAHVLMLRLFARSLRRCAVPLCV